MPFPVIAGAALGGLAMYFFDPDRGRRRRALVRDKAASVEHGVCDFVNAGTRDLVSRAKALAGQTRSKFTRDKHDDDKLAERIRARIGRHTLHPGAIEVSTANGVATLSGSILAHEHAEFLEAAGNVRGVKDVVDRLNVFETASGISELQGGRDPREGRSMRSQTWSPGLQLVAGSAAALALLRYSSTARALLGLGAAASLLAHLASDGPAGKTRHPNRSADTNQDKETAAPEEMF